MMTSSRSAPFLDRTVRRKVTASGVIWLDGHSYYVSRRLAGRIIPVTVDGGKLIVDAMIPLRKEYTLQARADVSLAPRPLRAARRMG